MRSSTRLAAALLAVAGVLAACNSSEGGVGDSPTPSSAISAFVPTPVPDPPPPGARGKVVSRNAFAGSSDLDGIAVTRVVYRSTAGYRPADFADATSKARAAQDRDGTFGTEVSGVVAVPRGTPPPGGWPIVALGHGTTGTDASCGPSAHPDLLGHAGMVAGLVRAGYVVAASDFQGLGIAQPGIRHPYLEPKTVAYNMIDMVRAARQIVPQASNRWAAVGSSQGGQAAWAAAEFAGEYGAGLQFVGSAALAPAVDVTGITDGGVGMGYTPSQKMFAPVVMAGMATVYPNLPVSDYLRGALTSRAADFTSCNEGYQEKRLSAALSISPGDATPVSDEAVDRMRAVLQSYRLPQRRAAGPMLVIYGDKDDVVDPSWVQRAVQDACRLGDVVQVDVKAGKGHTDLGANAQVLEWIKARFDKRPPRSTCS